MRTRKRILRAAVSFDDPLRFSTHRNTEGKAYLEQAFARTGFGALLLGYYDGAALLYAGKVGTGFDQKTLRVLRDKLDELARSECPFLGPPPRSKAHWVAPELVAQIGFTEWTREGRLRHPRYRGLRDDKPAHEVTREATSLSNGR